MTRQRSIQRWMKGVTDRGCALIGLVVLAPLFLAIAACIRFDSPGPVFFRQERSGKDGHPFHLWKFRTMVEGAERLGARYLVENGDPRITRVGRVLRRWSMDELPQLINVFRGEMSLIGPRPTLPYQIAQYTPRQRNRLAALPGLTGWAQVNGRNDLAWPERIELDIWYIENWSLWLDLKIVLRTVSAVASGRTVYADDLSKFDVRRHG